MSGQLWWYLARASGVVGWLAASASVLFGLALTLRLTDKPRPAWVLDVHKHLGALTAVFTALHLGALVADTYVEFGVADLLVPYASSWQPGPVAVGIVAFWGLVAIQGSSLLMRRLPRKVWRSIHGASFAVFVLTTGHALAAGTDASNAAFRATAIVISAAFVFLALARVLLVNESRRRRSPGRAATTAPAA